MGYVDGLNDYQMELDNPIASVDPQGTQTTTSQPASQPAARLTYETVGGKVETNDWGEFSWKVAWNIKPEPTSFSYVVQKVTATFDIRDKDGKAIKPDGKGLFSNGIDTNNWPLWEAWKYAPNDPVSIMRGRLSRDPDPKAHIDFDDIWNLGGWGKDTTGKIVITGEALFYEDMLHLPEDFKTDKTRASGLLPVTHTDPKLPGGISLAKRTLTITWDCANGGKTTAKVE